MRNKLRAGDYWRRYAFVGAVFLIFLFFMLWQVNFFLARNLKTTWYMLAVPALTAGVLLVRGLRDGAEIKLLVCYWLWYLLSRVLNGDPALVEDFLYVFDLQLMIPFLLLGLVLDAAGRRRFLNWFSAAVGLFHFALGLAALWAFLLRTHALNPITRGFLVFVGKSYFNRINILDTNPNASAFWFMMALLLMVYQFFACRRRIWRIPIVLAALVDYLVIAVTYTRSVKLAVGAAFGLLAVLLVQRVLKTESKGLAALLLVLVFALSAPLVYKSFDLATAGLGRLSAALTAQPAAEAAEASDDAESKTTGDSAAESDVYTDPRSWDGSVDSLSSGRLTVYKGALYTITKNPLILLRGCLTRDSMTLANEYGQFATPRVHYHNFLIQVLIVTGLPGLLLVLAFCLLVVVKTVKLFFCPDRRASLAVKTLCLPVTAALLYFLFEVALFTEIDVRALYSFLFFGLLLGWYYDLYPRKDGTK